LAESCKLLRPRRRNHKPKIFHSNNFDPPHSRFGSHAYASPSPASTISDVPSPPADKANKRRPICWGGLSTSDSSFTLFPLSHIHPPQPNHLHLQWQVRPFHSNLRFISHITFFNLLCFFPFVFCLSFSNTNHVDPESAPSDMKNDPQLEPPKPPGEGSEAREPGEEEESSLHTSFQAIMEHEMTSLAAAIRKKRTEEFESLGAPPQRNRGKRTYCRQIHRKTTGISHLLHCFYQEERPLPSGNPSSPAEHKNSRPSPPKSPPSCKTSPLLAMLSIRSKITISLPSQRISYGTTTNSLQQPMRCAYICTGFAIHRPPPPIPRPSKILHEDSPNTRENITV